MSADLQLDYLNNLLHASDPQMSLTSLNDARRCLHLLIVQAVKDDLTMSVSDSVEDYNRGIVRVEKNGIYATFETYLERDKTTHKFRAGFISSILGEHTAWVDSDKILNHLPGPGQFGLTLISSAEDLKSKLRAISKNWYGENPRTGWGTRGDYVVMLQNHGAVENYEVTPNDVIVFSTLNKLVKEKLPYFTPHSLIHYTSQYDGRQFTEMRYLTNYGNQNWGPCLVAVGFAGGIPSSIAKGYVFKEMPYVMGSRETNLDLNTYKKGKYQSFGFREVAFSSYLHVVDTLTIRPTDVVDVPGGRVYGQVLENLDGARGLYLDYNGAKLPSDIRNTMGR